MDFLQVVSQLVLDVQLWTEYICWRVVLFSHQ